MIDFEDGNRADLENDHNGKFLCFSLMASQTRKKVKKCLNAQVQL